MINHLSQENPRLLMHICCAPCATYPVELLKGRFNIDLLFHNPCIYPKEELLKRKETAAIFAEKMDLRLRFLNADEKAFLKKAEGLECCSEGSLRCAECFRQRIEKAAEFAKSQKADLFTTTLTVSPHKDSSKILDIGRQVEKTLPGTSLRFLDIDFKQDNGFQKSIEQSRSLGLYRQNYCGCRFSIRK